MATVTWTIDQVRRRLLPDLDVADWSDPTGRLALIDRSLPDAWAGKPLCDLEQPGSLSLVAVTRAGVPRLDARELVGQEGDVLHFAVLDDALDRLDEKLAQSDDQSATAGPAVKVAIAGAGSVGTAIASDLHANGHEVLVFEQDPELVERLRPTLDVTWVAADACEVSSLDAAGLATVDVVVAATGDDEDNLVISLLAKQEFAVPRVVARVNHPKNQWLFNESWGVDVSVSTPQLLTALVEEAVSVGSLVRLLQFQGGTAHLVEITLAEDSPANDTAIADLALPTRRRRGGRRQGGPPDRPPGRHHAAVRRRGARPRRRGRRGRGPFAVHRGPAGVAEPDRNLRDGPVHGNQTFATSVLQLSRVLKDGPWSAVPLHIWRRPSSTSTRPSSTAPPSPRSGDRS